MYAYVYVYMYICVHACISARTHMFLYSCIIRNKCYLLITGSSIGGVQIIQAGVTLESTHYSGQRTPTAEGRVRKSENPRKFGSA